MKTKKLINNTVEEFLKMEDKELDILRKINQWAMGFRIDKDTDGEVEYVDISNLNGREEMVVEIIKEGFEKSDENKIILYPHNVIIEGDSARLTTLADYVTIAIITIKKIVIYDNNLIQLII